MSLTVGSDPLGKQPAGCFNTEITTPTGAVLFFDPVPQRIRETGRLPVYSFPLEDVRLDMLEPSPKRTRCAYKGSASYRHVRAGGGLHDDIAWTYANPQHDAEQVRDSIAFFNERVELDVDGERVERPRTQWSR